MSHQGRACSRNLWRARLGMARQIARTCGRRPSTTLRQSPPFCTSSRALARSQPRKEASLAGDGNSVCVIGAGSTRRWACGRRPRRESATIGPRWPDSLSAIAASTIVSPVPRIKIVEYLAAFHEPGSSQGLTNGASSVSEASCPQHKTAVSKTAVSEPAKRSVTEPSRSLRPVTTSRSQRTRPGSVSTRRSSTRPPKVAAVDQARNKAKAILAPMAIRPKPIPEMIGVVGESAHVRRPDV